MKIMVTMKDPDTLADAIAEAAGGDVAALGLPKDEAAAILECRIEKAREVAATWFEYDEYLTVEIDTEARTCVVVPKQRR